MSNHNGSIHDPETLAEAVTDRRIPAGARVWLRGGTYSGDYVSSISGTAEAPITFRAYPGEIAIIDGGLRIIGDYITWQDCIIRWTGWTSRESAEAGSAPTDIPVHDFNPQGTGFRLINCVLHDLFSPGFWASADELYGCISFNHGWTAPDRGHGHGIYVQNARPRKRIQHNIIFNNFGWGIHCYGSSADLLDNISIESNIAFNAGILNNAAYMDILIGAGDRPTTGAIIRDNYTYGLASQGLQGYSAGLTGAVITDNYCPNGRSGTFAGSQESGNNWDIVGNTSFAIPNAYDNTRAHIAVYNADALDRVAVDVSTVASAGRSYRLRNAQDYFNDIQTGTVAGDGTITIDMQAANRSVQAPVAWNAPATTFPQFGAFVLELV